MGVRVGHGGFAEPPARAPRSKNVARRLNPADGCSLARSSARVSVMENSNPPRSGLTTRPGDDDIRAERADRVRDGILRSL
jgi:hypothetical protein